jgi:hypothetical protein
MVIQRVRLKDPIEQPERVLESVGKLKAKHGLVKEKSTEATECIKRFEEWVAMLPGRVETSVSVPDPDDDDYTLQLSIAREGKRWVVRYLYVPDIISENWDHTPSNLADASVIVKLAALPHLPRLVESMVESQDTLVNKLVKATSAFNTFAASVGIPTKAGG